MKFRHTNFMRLIYAVLLALPFVAILSRVIYVQSNKNAYQSYEGQIQYQQNVNVQKPSDLLAGKTYDITIIDNSVTSTNNASYKIGFSTFTLKDYLLDNGNTAITYASYFTIGGAVGYTDHTCFAWYDSNKVYLGRTELPLSNDIVNNLSFVFTDLDTSSPAYFTDTFKDRINVSNNIIVYSNNLANVFEYSINKFIENNNFGRINLFQWTTDLFFDSNNVNNMYVGFINWYLNYTLLVSATYILFLVLMWFINFARRLLERGMNYDW